MQNIKINILKKKIWLFATLLIASLMLSVTSCKEDFFDKQPPGEVTEDVIANEKGAETLLTGAYAALSGAQNSCYDGQYAGTDTRLWGSIAADDANTGSAKGDHPEMWIFEQYAALPSNPSLETKWNMNYDGVSRANKALEIINKASDNIPDERETEMKAEARFIRGFLHYSLKIVFKYIPYITKNVENPVDDMPYTEEQMEDPKKVPNMTSDGNEIDTWRLIEADLRYAVNNLPAQQENVGEIDKYAAEAVLARVHLMQADYDAAEPLVNDIINNSGAHLVEHFYWNYDIAHNNNDESIFEIQSAADPTGGTNTNSFCTAMGLLPQHLGGWGHYRISLQAVNAFKTNSEGLPEKNWDENFFKNSYGITSGEEFVPSDHPVDPRLDWTVGRRGIPFLDWGVHEGYSWLRSPDFGGVFNSKKHMYYQSQTGKGRPSAMWGGLSTQNYRKYRLGHVYLWKAEIETRKGNFDDARFYVNELRRRADNHKVMGKCYTYQFTGGDPEVNWQEEAANYNISTYDAEDFDSPEEAWRAIRTETLLETAGFGLRFFDLRRWEKADVLDMSKVLNDYIENDSQYRPLLKGSNFGEEDKYFPIPLSAIENQPGVIKQNPAYK